MPPPQAFHKTTSYALSQRAVDGYLNSVGSLPTHPLFTELPVLRAKNLELFTLFFQDLGELVALSIDSPDFFGRDCLAAQSARHTLALHPSWMRCASDLATQSRLGDQAFASLASWIE